MPSTRPTPPTTSRWGSRRAGTAAAAVLVALTAAGCSTAAVRPPATTAPSVGTASYASGYGPGSGPTTQATRTASRRFATEVDDATSGFVAAVGRLATDAAAGDTAAGRADELVAQADYDVFRVLDTDNSVNSSSLDELPTDVGSGASFGGLHAVERDLWGSGPWAADVASLAAQAPVAEFLLGRKRLGPEAIGSVAVDQLDWVADDALPVEQEPYSRLGLVDVAATEQAAHRSFSTVEPLASLVDPALATTVTSQFAVLDGDVAALGDPALVPDASVTPTARLALSRQLDATAADLARLAGVLAPYGTGGAPS